MKGQVRLLPRVVVVVICMPFSPDNSNFRVCALFTSVKAEKVNNPYGSTAGAGSGDFHVYRHARAREAERWKLMNAEEREKSLEEQYKKTL